MFPCGVLRNACEAGEEALQLPCSTHRPWVRNGSCYQEIEVPHQNVSKVNCTWIKPGRADDRWCKIVETYPADQLHGRVAAGPASRFHAGIFHQLQYCLYYCAIVAFLLMADLKPMRDLLYSAVVVLFSVVALVASEEQREFDYFALVRCGHLSARASARAQLCCVSLIRRCTEHDGVVVRRQWDPSYCSFAKCGRHHYPTR